MIMKKSGPAVLLFSFLVKYVDAALVSNSEGSPQVLSDMPNSNACKGPGRTGECTVELDVPSDCVSGGQSMCPVVFYLHGAGGKIAGFKRSSEVHAHGFVGVYPQGENGWNTGPKDTNNCDYTDYDCTTDPNEGDFIATIISEVQTLGANGSVYLIGNSNGAALAHSIAVNAGTQLPVKGIVTKVTQLLASPDRTGPGSLNYNYPAALSTPGPKVSVLNVMGTDDGLIPYTGGSSAVFGGNKNFQLMSALDSMKVWASHNGCSLTPISKDVETDTRAGGDGTGVFYQWENCSGGTIVEHYAINGGNHGSGGSSVDGIAIDYAISADFIKRCEDSEASPTVSPKPSPPPVQTNPPTTKVPSPPSVECSDDPDWAGKNNDNHDCDFVAERPENRCSWVNKEGISANEACKLSCDNCGDDETPPPSKSPSHSPSSACPQGESKFLVEIQADKKSRQHNLFIVQKQVIKGKKKKWKKVQKRNKILNNEFQEFDMCLASSTCYRFRMKDKMKDGLCCKNGDGYYKTYYEDTELEHVPFDEDFGKKFQNTKFGDC